MTSVLFGIFLAYSILNYTFVRTRGRYVVYMTGLNKRLMRTS